MSSTLPSWFLLYHVHYSYTWYLTWPYCPTWKISHSFMKTFVSHKMYSFWISPLKLKSVLQSVLANSSHAIVINTCTNLVLAVRIVLTSITFCALLILHVLNLYNLGCPQDYTVFIKKKLSYMQKIWKLTRGQICCWKRDLNFIFSSKRNTYVLFRPKQGRCLTADEAVAKIQEKDCLSCTTQYN